MNFKIGDKVICKKNKIKFYTIVNAKIEYEGTWSGAVYQLSGYNNLWFYECDLELYDELKFSDNKQKYNLTFGEVVDEIFETKGWYQGSGFEDENCFITIGRNGNLVLKYFDNNGRKATEKKALEITSWLASMKFCRIYR